MAYQHVFKRKEVKYLINAEQWQGLLGRFTGHMERDAYGKHLISNIYYDTQQWYLARLSLSKPKYKEKIRMRSYGVPTENDKVFLEMKKKYDGIVYKRRTTMPLKQAERFLEHKLRIEQPSQILSEFAYLLTLYPDLRPAMYISYERMAYFCPEDANVRITFDQNILYRTENLALSDGSYGKAILPTGSILMEVKIGGGMPLWLADAFTELKIYPAKYSKFSTGYQDYLSQKTQQNHLTDVSEQLKREEMECIA